MKKYLIISAFAFICISSSNAQQVANGGFENWTMKTLLNEPNGYSSSNTWAYVSGSGDNVTKDTSAYHGSFAAKLTTVQTQNDTIFGALFIGTPGDGGVTGGMPYTDQPDSVSGYVKYNIPTGDSAFFIVAFKNSGTMIAQTAQSFTGTQNTY